MMFYVATAVSNFLDRPQIETFHYDMFHGLAERDGLNPPHDTLVYANTESPSDLLISRTGHGVPDICNPSSHLVVNERIANELAGFPHIRLAKVVFKRLVDVEYEKGDMSWCDKWGDGDPCDLLRTLPDIAGFHEQIGAYYEVQTWRLRDVVDQFPSARLITIEVATPPLEETRDIRISSELLEEFPILCLGDVIMSEKVFRILDSSLDRDFFIVREYALPA